MVFFALTRQGVNDFRQLGGRASLWLSAGILTPAEISNLRAQGFSVTGFSSEIHPGDHDAVADAVSTIREHHPDETLWIEG